MGVGVYESADPRLCSVSFFVVCFASGFFPPLSFCPLYLYQPSGCCGMWRFTVVIRQDGYGDGGTEMMKQRGKGGKRNGPVEECWQGGTTSPAGVGAQGAVPVEPATVVSAKPLRLEFRGRGFALSATEARCGSSGAPASPFTGGRVSGTLGGSPRPSRHFSLLSVSQPRG
ncbi:hypothetical protein NDU88_006057 [Pleurodeles waltl]|uniref:Uncharacterized protein n=1 Tax=Pleurodeles waltl TaxID=8319 RepID=A0AAV7PH77_PLEWA|nr:hypothetical protein NDU88_006057 [Pleurodeles waltl]